MFATHFEPGKLAVLRESRQFTVVRNPQAYLQGQDGKLKEVQYIYPSVGMTQREAETGVTELSKRYPQLSFTTQHTGDTPLDYVIWARSNSTRDFSRIKSFQYFPDVSRMRKFSFKKLLEWQLGMPYASVGYESGVQIGENEYKNGTLVFTGSRASVDEILRDAVIYSFDLEAEKWMKVELDELGVSHEVLAAYLETLGLDTSGSRRERLERLQKFYNSELTDTIYSAAGASNNGQNHVVGRFGNGNETFDTPYGPIDMKLIDAQSQDDVVRRANELLHLSQALFVVGSNIGAYDIEKLRATGLYFSGVDGSNARLGRRIGFYRRANSKGREYVDMAALSVHAFPHTINNKLPTVLSHTLGTPVEKPNTYEEQTRDQIEWSMGWVPARDRQLRYIAFDINGPLAFAERYLQSLSQISEMLGISITDLCTIEKSEAGEMAWDRKYFLQHKTLRERQSADDNFSLQRLALRHLNLPDDLQLELFGDESDDGNGKRRVVRNKSGVFHGAHLVYLMPYVKACEPIIRNDPAANAVFARMREVNSPTERLMLALYLDAFVGVPVRELDKYNMTGGSGGFRANEINMKDFERKYGVSMNRLHRRAALALFGGMHRYTSPSGMTEQDVTGLRKMLGDLEVVNYSPYFVLVTHENPEEREKIIAQMEADGLVIDMGTGTFFSIENCRFAGYIGDLAVTQGVNVQATRGYKTFWEKKFLPEFIRLGMRGETDKAKDFLIDSCRLVRYVPPEEMEFLTIAGRDAEDYSVRAMVHRRVQNIQRANARKGEEVRERIESEEDLRSRFGKPRKNGGLSFDGVIGQFARAIIPDLTPYEYELIVSGEA